MEIRKIYPEYYRTPQAPDISAGQRGSPAFAGPVSDSSPRKLDSGVKSDVFEARHAVDKIKQLDKSVPANPFTASAAIPPIDEEKKHSPVLDFFNSPQGMSLLFIGGLIPMIRRNQSVFEKIENDNTEGALAQLGATAVNVPHDLTLLALVSNEFKKWKDNGFRALPKQIYQREMPLLRGGVLGGKFKWLEKFDDTLFETKFGDKIMNLFKVTVSEKDFIPMNGINSKGSSFFGVRFSDNSIQNIVGRSLLRISKLSIFTAALFEIPAMVKSVTKTEGTVFDKAKAFGKQLVKSSAFVGLVTTAVAVAGAIAFPYGIAAELGAMAIGSAVALIASKSLNKGIDNIIFKEKNSDKQIPANNNFESLPIT